MEGGEEGEAGEAGEGREMVAGEEVGVAGAGGAEREITGESRQHPGNARSRVEKQIERGERGGEGDLFLFFCLFFKIRL